MISIVLVLGPMVVSFRVLFRSGFFNVLSTFIMQLIRIYSPFFSYHSTNCLGVSSSLLCHPTLFERFYVTFYSLQFFALQQTCCRRSTLLGLINILKRQRKCSIFSCTDL